MLSASQWIVRHRATLAVAAAVVVVVACLNMAAGPRLAPGQWEYRTVVFKVEQGESPSALQAQFEGVLNAASADGWEFDGRCARLADDHFGVDYLVLRRRVR